MGSTKMISSVVKILTILTSILSLFDLRKLEVQLKNEKKGKKFVS